MEHKRVPIQLTLGKHYIVSWLGSKPMVCKFIKPTRCGFNLLNLETHKCILRQHVYPSKYERHMGGDWFWVNDKWKIINT